MGFSAPRGRSRFSLFDSKRRTLVLLLLLAATFFFIFYRNISFHSAHSVSQNEPALRGALAAEIDIPIRTITSHGKITKEEIYQIRKDAAESFPALLNVSYKPSEKIFTFVSDDKPWWSVQGRYYFGQSEKTYEGPPAEGLGLANPFLLLRPEFFHAMLTNGGLPWDRTKISDDSQLRDRSFPLRPFPQKLSWWPAQSRAEVVYDISSYLQALNLWTTAPVDLSSLDFAVIGYNAVDLSFRYVFLSLEHSQHILSPIPPTPQIILSTFSFLQDQCGNAEGCNSGGIPVHGLSEIKVDALPAQATFFLWKEKPSGAEQAPDMVFSISLN